MRLGGLSRQYVSYSARCTMLAALLITAVAHNHAANGACAIMPRTGTLTVEASSGALGQVVFVGCNRPRFGWVLESVRGNLSAVQLTKQTSEPRGGLRQTAYRIIAASLVHNDSTATATATHPRQWDSGWVAASNSVGVEWGGANLTAGSRISWTLQVKDAAGVAGAAVQGPLFEVSPLLADDWHAQWIVASNVVPPNACTFYHPSPPPLMRAEFTLPRAEIAGGGVAHASMHVVGLGWSQVFLNGQRVGQRVYPIQHNNRSLFSKWCHFDST